MTNSFTLFLYAEVSFNPPTLRKEITAEANKIVGGTVALVGEFPYQVNRMSAK